jgi:hypothetical protein
MKERIGKNRKEERENPYPPNMSILESNNVVVVKVCDDF